VIQVRNWALAMLALLLMVFGSVPGWLVAFLIFNYLSEQPSLTHAPPWGGDSG